MQALKQAARENDSARLDALCETWSLPATADRDSETEISAFTETPATGQTTKNEDVTVNESTVAGRR